MQTNPNHLQNELNKALEKLTLEVQEGLRHGFFEYVVTCETVKDRKRRLLIKAGKSLGNPSLFLHQILAARLLMK